jgi:hypothetical protein
MSDSEQPDTREPLHHIPEWCTANAAELEHNIHDATCPESAMVLTKAQFVSAAEGGALAAIEAYRILLDNGDSPEQALELAVDEASEGAMCFAGIGSCGRGWCKHS